MVQGTGEAAPPADPSQEVSSEHPSIRFRETQRSYFWSLAPLIAAIAVEVASRSGVSQTSSVVRAAAVAALYLGTCVIVITPGVALLSITARHRVIGPATGLGLLFAGTGSAAVIGFWLWYINPDLGQLYTVAVLGGSMIANFRCCHRGTLQRLDLSTPLTLVLLVGLAFTGLASLSVRLT